MVHGEVTYDHHHGHQTGSDWAAKVKLVKEGEELKVKLYQIIVVSAASFDIPLIGDESNNTYDMNRILLPMSECCRLVQVMEGSKTVNGREIALYI